MGIVGYIRSHELDFYAVQLSLTVLELEGIVGYG